MTDEIETLRDAAEAVAAVRDGAEAALNDDEHAALERAEAFLVGKADDESDHILHGIQKADAQFQANNEDLEAVLAGDIGVHAYYTDSGQVTRGVHTVILETLNEQLEEFHIDDETVGIHHGEVTPEGTVQVVLDQLNDVTYLSRDIREEIAESVEEHVRNRLDGEDAEVYWEPEGDA